ncbi:hypothetical protein [Symbiopectobacterium sp. RP]|uniref:hypothetical protein n=1 Tax=Symbiopectobacterium sp. RP TaxID=3248553 RepID=UPI003D2C18B6
MKVIRNGGGRKSELIANRLKNDYSQCPDMWKKNTANCYQNNVALLYLRQKRKSR